MNDEKIEQLLRELPAPELPPEWRSKIVMNAVRAARASESRKQVWPAMLVYLRNLCVRNPITAGAMAMVWALIFLLKATTPIDPQEKMLLAHFDPSKPVYLVSIHDQILLAQMAMDQTEQPPSLRMP